MENERFQLQNVAKTVEMAASSSKMLQIARKTGRKADPTKISKRKNKNPKQFRTLHLLPPNKFRTHLDLDFAVCWGLASAGSPEWSASH